MTSFVRRLVSGQKARFKDPILEMELDLVYVTDNIVIMGYPAQGLASLYRNKRADVRRFLDHRHEDLYRVYNFCPKTENEYDSDFFYDRVSRFPFPDHHVPPLSMIPLFVVDMTEWLESDPDAVAVIHCKAGKGRSGTMTCCYLLSLPYLPSPPQNLRNYSEMKKPTTPPSESASSQPNTDAARKESARAFIESTEAGARKKQEEWASHRRTSAGNGESMANKLGRYWENGRISAEARRAAANLEESGGPDIQPRGSSLQLGRPDMGGEAAREVEELADKLRAVFDLHTSRRMKPEKPPSPKKLSRSRSKSYVGQTQFGMTSLGQSRTDLRAGSTNSFSTLRSLGASPAGRSCDALHTMSASTSGRGTPAFGSGNPSTYTLGGGGSYNTMPRNSTFGASSLALNQNTEDSGETKKPRMGVSIPSQRRWVGYWARILAGKDARQALANPYSTAPRRQIRITRITVDRTINAPTKSTQGLTEKMIPHADSLSIQLGRYQDTLVDRLESWERGGRRRAKVFGENDPSLLAGDLDVEEQKQKEYLKQLKRSQHNLKCWNGDKFTKENDARSLVNRLGVNIKAEADMARNFDWRDDKPQLNYFAMLGENLKRVQLDEYGNEMIESPSREGLLSPDAAHELYKKERKSAGPQCWRYGFVPENEQARKDRNNSACSSDSGYFTNADATRRSSSSGEAEETHVKKSYNLGVGTESRKRLPSFLSRKPSMLLRKPSQASITTPPSSTGYVVPASDELKVGQIIDADREVCIKILIGRTGGKHSKLPDFTAAGWVWMIPSFEDPLTGKAKVGSRTVIRFDKDEIDFRKQPLGVCGIEVEWEWVTPGTEDEEEEEEEEMDSLDAPTFGRSGLAPQLGAPAWRPQLWQGRIATRLMRGLA